MKALITGVAGFVGSTLSERLLSDGHEVVGIDCFLDYYPRQLKQRNLEESQASSAFSFVEASLVDADLLPLLEGVDWVFHQAAQAGVRASWGDEFRIYSDNNVFATQRLLEASRESGIRKFIYASSSSVYGDTDDLPMHEGSRTQPVSPYGVTKLAAEHLAWLYWKNYAVPTVALRYFTVYGPRQRPDMAFHRFARAVIEERDITLYGDGSQSRDFTYVDDIVAANLAAAQSELCGEVYNIGGGSRIAINEVIATIGRIVGKQPRVNRLEVQKGDVRHTAADISRAGQAFGYKPRIDIEKGLVREVEWLQGLLQAGAL